MEKPPPKSLESGRAALSRNLRAAAFVLLVLLIAFGPAYQQVFGRENLALRAWVMFQGYGLNIFQVRFRVIRPDGTSENIRWMEMLGYPDARQAPAELRKITSIGKTFEIAKEVRRQVPRNSELYMSVRMSGPDGWVNFYHDFPIHPGFFPSR